MISCPGCNKSLDESLKGSFCPYCGGDLPKAGEATATVTTAQHMSSAPDFELEVQRAKFVIDQRCLLKFRLSKRSDKRLDLQVMARMEHHRFEQDLVRIGSEKLSRPVQFSYAFTPKTAGEYRIEELSVIASSTEDPHSNWVYKLGEDELSLIIARTEGSGSGVVYNIRVQEMIGADMKFDQGSAGGHRPMEIEWQPIRLVLDEDRTKKLRTQGKKPEPMHVAAPAVIEPPPPPPTTAPLPPKVSPPQPPPVAPANRQVEEIDCGRCGRKIWPGTITCPHCGMSPNSRTGPATPPRAPAAQGTNYTTHAIICGLLTFVCLIGIIPNLVFMLQANAEKARTGIEPEGRKLLVGLFWGGLVYTIFNIGLLLLMIAAENM